jgi:hypothetical protein
MPGNKWKVEALPAAERQFIDEYLVTHDFHFLEELCSELARRGATITVSSLKGYAKRFRHAREIEDPLRLRRKY